MSTSFSTQDEQSITIVALITSYPYISVLAFIVACCISTRVKSGSQAHYRETSAAPGVPRSVPVVPYWLPLIGHTISFGIGFNEYLKKLAYSIPNGIFALRIGGATHNIVISPSMTREILNKPSLPLSNDDIIWRFLELSFGDKGAFREWNERDPTGLNQLTLYVHNIMKDPFLSEAIPRTVQAVEQRTWNLISGNESWVDHSGWERAGKVSITSISPKDGSFVAEADLFGLSRHFVGDIATSLLMGHCFLENNPNALDDLWLFDSKVQSMMLGLPWWLMPGVPPAVGARERLIDAIAEHHKALMDTLEGRDPGYKYNDFSDVSSVVLTRTRGFHDAKASPRTTGAGDLTLIWAMNVNANQVIFWMLFFIYSRPELLAEVRAEISPYVKLHHPDSGLAIKPAPELKIDIDGLMAKCPILKGCFFETMRFSGATSTFRVALDDFVLSESKDDAMRYGKSQPEKYSIRKGDIVNVPYIVQQENPLHYDRPEQFDHKRFWVSKKDDEGREKISVEYGNMRPWGGGKTMCKGRTFAEREVMAFASAIFTIWDMKPASGKDSWKHPGNVQTAGTYIPKKDIRVKLWRRKL